jgi:16S rRNA C967 or C1407 C5-methylase (RsmB/RsmF family)
VGDMFLRLSPHHHGTDGFFAAAMERSLPVR